MSHTSVIKALPDIVLVVRRDGQILDSLGGRTFNFELAPDSMVGSNVNDVLPSVVAQLMSSTVARVMRSREPVTREVSDGDDRYELRVSPHGRDRVLAVLRDLGATDGTTSGRLLQPDRLVPDLAGREQFVRALETLVDEAVISEQPLALIGIGFSDADNALSSLDHDGVDALLRVAGERLCAVMRASDDVPRLPPRDNFVAARIERDQFCVVMPRAADAERVDAFAQALGEALLPVYDIAGRQVQLAPSIGMALFPQDGNTAEHILRSALTAMGQADSLARSGVERYTDTRRIADERRQDLAEELRWAIDENQLCIYYQPVFELASANPISIEAFLRWEHPLRGLLTAGAFLPLAEATGQIQRISEWVLQQVCKDLKNLRETSGASLRVSINCSRHYFSRPDLIEHLEQVFEETQFDPCWLQLDITERMLMRTDYVGPLLARLKTLGVGLQIDDFGSGFTSLKQLRKMPLDALKIDGDFIAGIGHSEDDETLCRAIVSLAHAYGMRCVAEAVESREQVSFLRSCGCDDIQGKLFGAEMPVHLMGIFLEQFQHGRSFDGSAETQVVTPE